jgi:hypothetical protein
LQCFCCNTDPIYPAIPEIEMGSVRIYKNRLGKDSMVILKINYKDGDGDLGLNESDSLPPFNFGNIGFYNLKIDYKVWENNTWKKIIIPQTNDTVQFHQRFLRLNNTDKAKTVLGTMEIRIPASPYPGIKPETIQLSCQMTDRKLHYSNPITTSDIILKH